MPMTLNEGFEGLQGHERLQAVVALLSEGAIHQQAWLFFNFFIWDAAMVNVKDTVDTIMVQVFKNDC